MRKPSRAAVKTPRYAASLSSTRNDQKRFSAIFPTTSTNRSMSRSRSSSAASGRLPSFGSSSERTPWMRSSQSNMKIIRRSSGRQSPGPASLGTNAAESAGPSPAGMKQIRVSAWAYSRIRRRLA